MKNTKKNKAFVKPSGAKQSKFFIHVAVARNINNVVVNKPANPHKIRDCGFFYDYNIQVKIDVSTVLDKF
jgi:hypothetical protein